jgi:hypothetical protein
MVAVVSARRIAVAFLATLALDRVAELGAAETKLKLARVGEVQIVYGPR